MSSWGNAVWRRARRIVVAMLMSMTMALAVMCCSGDALAQTPPAKSPLGIGPAPSSVAPRSAPTGPLDRLSAWILGTQQALHRQLADAVKAIGADSPVRATLFLMALSFAYGIFHAAGPGHGKAVISSYVLADGRTVRRGIQLSFLAAFFQALSALVLVAILGLLFNVTGLKRRVAEAWLETASWGLVALLGAWLLYGQVRRLLAARTVTAHDHGHAHGHDHAHHGRHHDHDHDHAHHAHSHDATGACGAHHGHAHLPGPDALEGDWSWRRALGMAFAVGVRPCTGAIVVLVFAISQGLLWAGVLSTFAMALGTAITVSVLAAIAVGSRELAARLAAGRSLPWAGHVRTLAGLAGSAVVLVLGALFCYASIVNPMPL